LIGPTLNGLTVRINALRRYWDRRRFHRGNRRTLGGAAVVGCVPQRWYRRYRDVLQAITVDGTVSE